MKIKVGLLLIAVLGSSLMAESHYNAKETSFMKYIKQNMKKVTSEKSKFQKTIDIKEIIKHSDIKNHANDMLTSDTPTTTNRVSENQKKVSASTDGSTKIYSGALTSSSVKNQTVKIAMAPAVAKAVVPKMGTVKAVCGAENYDDVLVRDFGFSHLHDTFKDKNGKTCNLKNKTLYLKGSVSRKIGRHIYTKSSWFKVPNKKYYWYYSGFFGHSTDTSEPMSIYGYRTSNSSTFSAMKIQTGNWYDGYFRTTIALGDYKREWAGGGTFLNRFIVTLNGRSSVTINKFKNRNTQNTTVTGRTVDSLPRNKVWYK